MSVPLTINGVTFQYPQEFDKHWGPTLTNWSTAVTNALLPLTGGYLTRANNTTGIQWRNFLNTGYLALAVNASNQLTFNGIAIGATAALTDGHILVGNVSNVPTDVAMTGDITISDTGLTTLGALKVTDAQISTTASIALSKLASTTPYYWYVANSAGVLTPVGITASKVIISDSNGLPSASSVTPTTLAYLDATSSVQGQLNGITGSYLPLAGGTMSGAISMASHKITAVTQGTTNGDAISFPVSASEIAANTITASQIANHTVTASQIANNTITASQIANGTVTATQIASNTVTASQIANNTITASQIANTTITASQIANGTITTTQLSAGVNSMLAPMEMAVPVTLAAGGTDTFNYSAHGGRLTAIDMTTVGVLSVVIDGLTIISGLSVATGHYVSPVGTDSPNAVFLGWEWKSSVSVVVGSGVLTLGYEHQ